MKDEQSRPSFEAEPAVIIAYCLKRPVAYVEARLVELAKSVPSPENDDGWDRHDTALDAAEVAKAWGLPHDPDQHQQPHDVARMIESVFPIHSDSSNDKDEIVVNRCLYRLFLDEARTLHERTPREEAWTRFEEMMIDLNHYFGSDNRVIRESRIREAKRLLVEWFRPTDGFHDPESGVVDVDAAASREFLKGAQ
jgi:hypothetical protein